MEKLFLVGGSFTPKENSGPVLLPTADQIFSPFTAPSNVEVADPIALPQLGIGDLYYQRDQVSDEILGQLGDDETASIAGHSNGGLIATNIMGLHPDRIRRTFAIATPFDGILPSAQNLLSMAQYFHDIDLSGYEGTLGPFMKETLANYSSQLPRLARRLIMIAARGDDVVGLPSAWDERYESARRIEVPIGGFGSHFAITSYPSLASKIMGIHRTPLEVPFGSEAA